MPLFAIRATDRDDALQLRMDTREKHLQHLERLGDRLKAAGPTLDGNGKPAGSLVIFEATDQAEARAFADADPYAEAGLFARVEVMPWNALLGEWRLVGARDEEE